MMPTEQKPIGSGYGPDTTAQDVIAGTDLTGKVAIVTGGYSGMGLEIARTLAEAGATVVANHLGHFQLTLRLWPALVKAQGARVVSVSSRGHQVGWVDFDDPNYLHREYDKWAAYGQSKTANALFAVGPIPGWPTVSGR